LQFCSGEKNEGIGALRSISEYLCHQYQLLNCHCHPCLGAAVFFDVAGVNALAGLIAIVCLPAVARPPYCCRPPFCCRLPSVAAFAAVAGFSIVAGF